MKRGKRRETGVVLIAVALLIVVLLMFTVIGFEVGRWYMVRAELSKSVDAAALAAAKSIANPFVDPATLAVEFGEANFPNGYLGTPGAGGTGAATFTASMLGHNRVQVNGQVSASALAPLLLGYSLIPVSSSGVAQKKDVEIMLVLDRSYSMAGRPMTALKRAANTFVDFFSKTQEQDKVGLISFASSVNVNLALGTNYVTAMHTAINSIGALGGTNTEDAIDQADGPQGFTDQTGIPGDRRVQQFLVLFSDGKPTGFRGDFLSGGVTYDGVAGVANGNCVPGDMGITWELLNSPTTERVTLGPDPQRTGDGITTANCNVGGNRSGSGPTTRWLIFDSQPVPGYSPTARCIPDPALAYHICDLCSGLALQRGQELKNKGIVIYTIGLGADNATFLRSLATSPDLFREAPDADQLEAIFEQVAKDIQLRLVQ